MTLRMRTTRRDPEGLTEHDRARLRAYQGVETPVVESPRTSARSTNTRARKRGRR